MAKALDRWTPSLGPGTKWCSQCKKSCQPNGGMQIIAANKLTQRWICSQCKNIQDGLVKKVA